MAIRQPKRDEKENFDNFIEIKYNPYTYKLEILDCSEEIKDNLKLKMIIEKNKDKGLYHWYREFLETIKKEINRTNFTVIFNGRSEDYDDIKDGIISLEKEYGWGIKSQFKELSNKENILEELSEYVSKLMEKAPEELIKEINEKEALEEFENAKKSEAEVSIIATMSSGKSTLLNAILGRELLPSKNEACTATICRIKDVDGMENFRLKVENLDGKIISDWHETDLKDMEKFNEAGNENGINLYVEGDIPGIDSEEMNLILIDTPGPNNSQNTEHKEATYNFINDTKNNPLVLYVMNATQHGTNDDERLLTEISAIIKNNGKQAEERFIFALNKIDCFDPEKESIDKLIENSKKYLRKFGIENPKIFPISAEAAKLVRLNNRGENLSRSQSANLRNFEYSFLPVPEENYPGIDTIKYASISEEMKEFLYKDSEENQERALLHYSGISAIELYIDRYVNKYAKSQKIKDAISTLKKVIDNGASEINLLNGKTSEAINEIINQVQEIEEVLQTKGKSKLEEVRENIKKLGKDNEEWGRLFRQISKTFMDLKNDLSERKISKEKAQIIIENANKDVENLVVSLKSASVQISEKEVYKIAQEIIEELKRYFSDILENIDLNVDLKEILMGKIELELPRTSTLIREESYSVNEVVGQKYVGTESAATWWNPFTWFDREDVYEDIYENKVYVNLENLQSKYEEMEDDIRGQVANIQTIMLEKINILKDKAMENTAMIEKNIEVKMKEMKEKMEIQRDLKEKTEEFKKKLNTINEYKNTLDNILEI